MAVDPGETNGLAWAILNTDLPHPAETLSVGQLPLIPAKGTWHETFLATARHILGLWYVFRWAAEHEWDVPTENHVLVFEDFILRPVRNTKRQTLSPVYISSAFEGLRYARTEAAERAGIRLVDEPPVQWSNPSLLTSLPEAGLRQAKLWTPGREHARSATIHLVATARKMGYSGLLSPRESVIRGFFPFNED